jgi:hypothetical protein
LVEAAEDPRAAAMAPPELRLTLSLSAVSTTGSSRGGGGRGGGRDDGDVASVTVVFARWAAPQPPERCRRVRSAGRRAWAVLCRLWRGLRRCVDCLVRYLAPPCVALALVLGCARARERASSVHSHCRRAPHTTAGRDMHLSSA